MQQIVDQVFADQRVSLDGKQFIRCAFINATLVVAGTDQFALQQARMENVSFEFEGMAARLVGWLKQLRAGGIDVLAG